MEAAAISKSVVLPLIRALFSPVPIARFSGARLHFNLRLAVIILLVYRMPSLKVSVLEHYNWTSPLMGTVVESHSHSEIKSLFYTHHM